MKGTVAKTGTHTRHSGKGTAARRAEGEAMLADQVRGMRPTELEAKYGVSRATLYRRLESALNERAPVTAEKRRGQLNASLDEQLVGWQQNLDAGNLLAQQASVPRPDPFTGVPVVDTAVLERALKIRADALAGIARVDERRAKLNGTDAPVKTELEVVQVTPQERELRDLLEQAARDQAAREADLVNDDSREARSSGGAA